MFWRRQKKLKPKKGKKKTRKVNTKSRGKRAPQAIEKPQIVASVSKVTSTAPKRSTAAKPIKQTLKKTETKKKITPTDVASGWDKDKKGSVKK
ncbi:MAG: hypothetical protein LBJ20_03720 [Candidatus Methanoplasma sp.]|nr:hypothetical protein [Candidatus Methanoplasma sp.]